MIPERTDIFKIKALDNTDFRYKLIQKLDEKNKQD